MCPSYACPGRAKIMGKVLSPCESSSLICYNLPLRKERKERKEERKIRKE
jgi:hypothetical protein